METIRLEKRSVGLSGWIALDGSSLPAFGGIRIADYPDDDACLRDALRLARAMTRKCAFHGIPGVGGKATIESASIRDRAGVIEEIARAVNQLDGRFFTGPDTGLRPDDITELAALTRFVSTEDTASATARGVLRAIEATCVHAGVDLAASSFAIQGLGAVGMKLATSLRVAGARVLGDDVNSQARDEAIRAGVEIVRGDELLRVPCDVLCPCALGGVIRKNTVRLLGCRALVAAANNVLEDDGIGQDLHEQGILFIPDFVANGGGVIRGAWTHLRGTPGSEEEIDAIGERTRSILADAARRNVSPLRVAGERAPSPDPPPPDRPGPAPGPRTSR